MYLAIYLIFHLVCGFVSVGFFLAYAQGEFPTIAEEHYRDDLGMAILMSFLGPISLLISIFGTGLCKYGWRLKR